MRHEDARFRLRRPAAMARGRMWKSEGGEDSDQKCCQVETGHQFLLLGMGFTTDRAIAGPWSRIGGMAF
jgi:hypothetical protein